LEEEASWRIYRVSVASGDAEVIFAWGSKAAPSGDGRIAYGGRGSSIFIDGVRVPMARLAANTRPAWVPGQSKLVVSLSTDGISQGVLHRVDLDGSVSPFLKQTPLKDEIFNDPQYSPGGEGLLYVRWGANVRHEIWLADAEGENTRRLTTGHSDWAPSWSPSGTRIAFIRDGALHIMEADGSQVQQMVPGTVQSVAWLVP
jgi:Tol biopolymer transport system component